MSKIDIGLIQDKYTNFITYDKSLKCDGDDWILTEEINSLTIILKEESEKNNKIYKFDNTNRSYVIGHSVFESYDFSTYLGTRTLSINVNGIDVSVELKVNIPDATVLVDTLNALIAPITTEIVLTNNGGIIEAHTTTTGYTSYIQVNECSMLEVINWNKGIYKGNDFEWNTTGILQKDFNFQIDYDDMGYENEIPESCWNVQVIIEYTRNTTDYVYTSEYVEFTYKQSEIYRAKMFEYIANNYTSLIEVEQRLQTDFEIFMQKSVYYDSLFKAFLASIEIGNKTKGLELLDYIIEYKQLNPIL